jgi:transcription-repair coupling factor (superfamily II helicase)
MKNKLFTDIANKQKIAIYPALSDSHSYILSQLSYSHDKLLFIAKDDVNIYMLAEQLKFFRPGLRILVFPSWDCSVYDKISPNISNLNQRIKVLSELSEECDKVIVITCLSALIQKLPPSSLLPELGKIIRVNDVIKRDAFLALLVQLSFRRVEVASETGDFAVRGNIIDIIASAEEGWRLDFFGSTLEKIRVFDPITQISTGSFIQEINLLPSSEVVLNSDTITHFCKSFHDEFGPHSVDNPLYEAIEQGRKYPGMEHYLPCFYKNLSDLFDYFSPNQVICDNDFEDELKQKIKSINDHYESRQDHLVNRFKDEVIYYPVKPETMWLNLEELSSKLSQYKLVNLYNFNVDLNNAVDLAIKRIDNFDDHSRNKSISAFDLFKEYRDKNKKKLIVACYTEGSLQRIQNILENYNIHWYRIDNFEGYKNITGKTVGVTILPIDHGYSFEEFAIISEQDLLGDKIIRKKSKQTLENILSDLNSLQIGEHVVHQKHGIGLFSGLETLTVVGLQHDCIKIVYDGNDILYIPVENLDLLTRYGSNDDKMRLDKLGSSVWKNRKSKLKEKLKEIAAELIKTAAIRAGKEGEHLSAMPGAYEEFCARFPYLETEDQMNSIKDVEGDLSSGTPMDRLICGDVGFGKTEVAMRAAFVATNPEHNVKKQVAIIVPTTLLARQHYHSFFKRFSGFNVQVKQLSRLVSAKDAKLTKQGIKDGDVDIVVGTHALLAKDVEFKNLGLLIVDEEQRFGVTQKEKLKKVQENIHILTLSATPIPRTLQMSLTGVRDLSLIASPPVDRQVVKTYIMNYDSVMIREAILREFYRGGQTFFVCPRISDVNEILPKLTELVPEIKIVVAHGQMSPSSLEEIMSDFYNKKFHLLLSTGIVESGIDIPEANTIFIHRADRFGLSALYQLRGRVGRSNIKAFSYLLLPNKKLSKLAMARLEVMQTLDTLGAGFTVASHDMDIRGFGNLVGDQQSGHIREVGLELYQQMLQDAIFKLKNPNEEEEDHISDEYSPQINIDLPVMLPDHYIADLNLRLSLYRHLAEFKSSDEVDIFAVELIDRFGKYPIEVEYLLSIIKLKIKSKKINIDKIDAGPKAITLSFHENKCLKPDELLEFMDKNQSYIRLRPDHKILVSKAFSDPIDKLKFIDELLTKIDF